MSDPQTYEAFMSKSIRFTFSALATILTLLFSLTAGAGAAFADELTPPPSETPEIVTTPEVTEEGSGSLAGQPTEPGVEPTSPSEETLETPSAMEEVSPTEAEEVQIADLLAEASETTDVVILNEEGESLPLASQEAAEIAASVDPMWCPVIGGVPTLPGGLGCTINFGSNQALIDNIDSSNPGTTASNYEQNGIIYFTETVNDPFLLIPGGGTALQTSDYNAIKIYDLILQGGWNGFNDGAGFALNGQSNFDDNRIQIGTNGNRWTGNITLQDITMSGVSNGNGVTVYTTTGDITLDNVDVLQQGGNFNTALLNSNSGGDITVQNDSTFDGNGNNRGFSATTNTGTITITGTSTNPITFTDARGAGTGTNFNGATLSAPTVTLTDVLASGNDLNGIVISNANSVTLNNVIATNNGTDRAPIGATNNLGSGVSVNGTGPTVVTVNGGSFTGNQLNGIVVTNANSATMNSVTASNNDLNGILITTTNSVALNNVTASNNGTNNVGSGVNVTGTGSTIVTVTGGTFTGNRRYGIELTGTGNTLSIQSPPTCSPANVLGCYFPNSVPSLNVPANMTVEASGPGGAAVSYTATASDAQDVSLTPSCSPASGSTFPIATMTVNCSVTDSGGLTANRSFTVTVRDTTPPALTLPPDTNVEATGPSGAVATYSASASDIVDGAVSVNCAPASGSTFPIATSQVNCSATDASGNTASGSFNVTVQDTTPPVIAAHENIAVSTRHRRGSVLLYGNPATSDIVDGAGLAQCSPASGSMFPEGDTLVTCSATDAHGNTAVPTTFRVHVDYIKPTGSGIIPVTGGDVFQIGCTNPATYSLEDIRIAFVNLCNYQAVLDKQEAAGLPGKFPNGTTFVSGLTVSVLQDGSPVDSLPNEVSITLSFAIPSQVDGDRLTILRRDGGQWVEVGGAAVDGRFEVTVDITGTFVLVWK